MKKLLAKILMTIAVLALAWMLCVEDPGWMDCTIPAILVIASVKTLEKLDTTDNKA